MVVGCWLLGDCATDVVRVPIIRREAMIDMAEIGTKIQADIITAMKAKDEHKLTTLRMVKSAMKNKEIDKREKLTDAEEQQILTTLIKQRKESVESFTKGGRKELAEKEQAEIVMIEGHLPKA